MDNEKKFWTVSVTLYGESKFEELYVFDVEADADKKVAELEERIARGRKIYESGTHCADAHLHVFKSDPRSFGEQIYMV